MFFHYFWKWRFRGACPSSHGSYGTKPEIKSRSADPQVCDPHCGAKDRMMADSGQSQGLRATNSAQCQHPAHSFIPPASPSWTVDSTTVCGAHTRGPEVWWANRQTPVLPSGNFQTVGLGARVTGSKESWPPCQSPGPKHILEQCPRPAISLLPFGQVSEG